MRKFILMPFILFLVGCTNHLNHYKEFADTAISFFNTTEYSTNKFSKRENELLDKYLSTLTHENEIIDLEQYIEESSDYYTEEGNSSGVYIENNKCYIKYEDLHFKKIETDAHGIDDDLAKVVCNNYFTILLNSQFIDYNDIKSNKKYNYRYLGYLKNDSNYQFVYRSYYDGSGLVVSINTNNNQITELEIIDTNVNDYVFSEDKNGNLFGVVFILAIIFIIILLVIRIFKKIKNNNSF